MRTQESEAAGSTSLLTSMLSGGMPAMPAPAPGSVRQHRMDDASPARRAALAVVPTKPAQKPREFTSSDKALIRKVHGYMAPLQLLGILNERLVCDVGDSAALYTIDQLKAEIAGVTSAVPAGGNDWGTLRKLLAKARRDEYVSRTDATRWVTRKCPSGESTRSWISLQTACDSYYFTMRELRGFIDTGKLKLKEGTSGAAKGVEYVPRQQCAQLREQIGFTEEQAARRLGVTVERFRHLVDGVDWRGAEKIPLVTVQAVRKRLESRQGYTIEEAAAALGRTEGWVKEQIEKGATRVSRAKWDRRRLYITEPMLQPLREVSEQPSDVEKLGAEWLSLSEAALEAAVSLATLNAWGVKGKLPYKEHKGVRHYHREAVRARARSYWENPRSHRAVPPAWFQAETCAA